MKIKIIYITGIVVLLGIIMYIFLPHDPMVVENLSLDDLRGATTSEVTINGFKGKVIQKRNIVENKDVYTITYTAKGFEPKEIQIPRGTTLKFVNKTNTSMKVFADDDAKPPYSDLSQPKALGLNGEYVFNFVYAGVWKYYNSIKPEDVGNIVVY
ncbi:MAG: cupredoxin domain-containing protein [Minisyncoccota bacterium]